MILSTFPEDVSIEGKTCKARILNFLWINWFIWLCHRQSFNFLFVFSSVFSKHPSMNESACLFWGGRRSNKKGGNGVPPPQQWGQQKPDYLPSLRMGLAVPGINCVFGRPAGLCRRAWMELYEGQVKVEAQIMLWLCSNPYQRHVFINEEIWKKVYGEKMRNAIWGEYKLEHIGRKPGAETFCNGGPGWHKAELCLTARFS